MRSRKDAAGWSAAQQAPAWKRLLQFETCTDSKARRMPTKTQSMNWNFATPWNYNATVKDKCSLGPEQRYPGSLLDEGILSSGERSTSGPTCLPACLIFTTVPWVFSPYVLSLSLHREGGVSGIYFYPLCQQPFQVTCSICQLPFKWNSRLRIFHLLLAPTGLDYAFSFCLSPICVYSRSCTISFI